MRQVWHNGRVDWWRWCGWELFLAKLPSSSQTQPLLARGQLALSKGLRRASTSPASTQQSPSLHLLLSAVVTFTVDYRQRMFCAIFSFTLRFTLQAGAPILILHLVSEIFNLKILLHLNIERVHLRLSDIYPGLTNYRNSLKHQKSGQGRGEWSGSSQSRVGFDFISPPVGRRFVVHEKWLLCATEHALLIWNDNCVRVMNKMAEVISNV